MRPPDPSKPVTIEDDHCLVHHFIRSHGRRPTADELRALREGVAGALVPATLHATLHAATPAALAQALRRELAKFVTRW